MPSRKRKLSATASSASSDATGARSEASSVDRTHLGSGDEQAPVQAPVTSPVATARQVWPDSPTELQKRRRNNKRRTAVPATLHESALVQVPAVHESATCPVPAVRRDPPPVCTFKGRQKRRRSFGCGKLLCLIFVCGGAAGGDDNGSAAINTEEGYAADGDDDDPIPNDSSEGEAIMRNAIEQHWINYPITATGSGGTPGTPTEPWSDVLAAEIAALKDDDVASPNDGAAPAALDAGNPAASGSSASSSSTTAHSDLVELSPRAGATSTAGSTEWHPWPPPYWAPEAVRQREVAAALQRQRLSAYAYQFANNALLHYMCVVCGNHIVTTRCRYCGVPICAIHTRDEHICTTLDMSRAVSFSGAPAVPPQPQPVAGCVPAGPPPPQSVAGWAPLPALTTEAIRAWTETRQRQLVQDTLAFPADAARDVRARLVINVSANVAGAFHALAAEAARSREAARVTEVEAALIAAQRREAARAAEADEIYVEPAPEPGNDDESSMLLLGGVSKTGSTGLVEAGTPPQAETDPILIPHQFYGLEIPAQHGVQVLNDASQQHGIGDAGPCTPDDAEPAP
jgi:hypothetical protein